MEHYENRKEWCELITSKSVRRMEREKGRSVYKRRSGQCLIANRAEVFHAKWEVGGRSLPSTNAEVDRVSLKDARE